MHTRREFLGSVVLVMLLTAACVWIYAPATGHERVSFSDARAPIDDPAMTERLDLRWIGEAILHPHDGTWAPLARIGQRIDVALFGFDRAAPVLIVDLVLVVAAGVLFASVLGALGLTFPARAVAAGLLVLHPVVADLACRADARGDLLALVLLLIAMLSYASRARAHTTTGLELALTACTVLAVMASPAGVLVPFALTWIDVWRTPEASRSRAWLRESFLAKLPLFAIALLGLALSWLAARRGAASLFAEALDFPALVVARVHAWATMLTDLVWPFAITTLRSHATSTPDWTPSLLTIAAAVLLILLAHRMRRAKPSVAVITVVLASLPALFVPGPWAPAARWALVPLLALSIVAACVLTTLRPRPLSVAIAIAVLGFLGWRSAAQVPHWRDATTALEHAVDVDPASWLAHDRLARDARARGDLDRATTHAIATLTLAPGYGAAVLELAGILFEQEDPARAELLARHAVRTHWSDRDAPLRLGLTLARAGFEVPARALLRRTLASDPASADAHAGLALALARSGETEEAITHVAAIDEAELSTTSGSVALVWLLASAPEAGLGDPARALRLADRSGASDEIDAVEFFEARAIALARLADWPAAFETAQHAARLAAAQGWRHRDAENRARALAFLQRRAWTEPRAQGNAVQR